MEYTEEQWGEFERRAQEIYNTQLKAILEPAENGKSIAIDVESGEYVVDTKWTRGIHTLRQRHPNAHGVSFVIGPATPEEHRAAAFYSKGHGSKS